MGTGLRSFVSQPPRRSWAWLLLFWAALALVSCERPSARTLTRAPGAPARRLQVSFLDVGQGDSALVQAPDGRTLLIDAGDTDQGGAVLAALRERGIRRLDWAVASHPHADHIGGFPDVLPEVHALQFLDSGFATGSRIQQKVLKLVRDTGAKYTLGQGGGTFDLGGVRVEVLAPWKQWVERLQDNANNASVVLRLTYGNTRFLFTGDMEGAEREQLYRSPEAGRLPADVLKVAHHGSHNGTDPEFLQHVRPRLAVISCGKGNEYGHPHREALQALAQARVRVYRTDQEGTITISSDGTRLDVATASGSSSAPARPEAAAPSAERGVIGNRRTHIYHRPDCSRLPGKSNRVTFASADEARAAGYRPDPACAP